MKDLATTIDTYLEAYSETNEARRDQLIDRVFVRDGRLVDPPLEAQGRAAISGMAAAVHGQFPGHRFRRSTAIDDHHGFARYGWELVDSSGAVTLAGMDVTEVDTNGQIVRVTGFFGDLPVK